MGGVFPLPEPVTPGWLTDVLREAGVLTRGSVESIEEEGTGAFNSATMRLRVSYSPDASEDAPTRLVLKRNIPTEWGREAGADEVRFYRLMASLPDVPGIVPCYAAALDEESGDSLVLLRDLAETHRPPRTRNQVVGIVEGVPDAADIAAVVEALARVHAYWWNSPLLGEGHFEIGYWTRSRERFAAYLARRMAAWQRVLERDGEWLPAEVRKLYEGVFARLPAFWERWLRPRFACLRDLTLTHGDAYFANFLCPTPPTTGATYLIDWQSPGVDIGAYDLVNLCATFWTSEQRHEDEREVGILRHYLATLQASGVTEYGWEDLLRDYRLGLVFWLLMPVQDAADGSARDYWWPKMQCLMAAFREWGCEEMMEGNAGD